MFRRHLGCKYGIFCASRVDSLHLRSYAKKDLSAISDEKFRLEI